ncbi:hypothetical protein HJC23_013310 [Cyclotella cryptica]|uniref:Uncharacterized protein n=1 Tax=Cyclotella cryptica TaxID=29204 RepID=A0ABD3Q000_9STRA
MEPPEESASLLSSGKSTGRPPLYPKNASGDPSRRRAVSLEMESHAPSARGVPWRKLALLLILTVFTFFLLMLSQREEGDLEGAVRMGDVEPVWHDEQRMQGMADVMEDTATDQAQTLPESSSSSSSKEESAESPTTSSSTSMTEWLTGFHSPSPQSFTDRVIHFKPKGVGYPLRPVGGLHPIYYLDITNASSLEEAVSDGDYSRFSPYADGRLQLSDEERQQEQDEYMQKLQSIRDEWGFWNFKDTFYKGPGKRPFVDWEVIKSKKQGTEYDVLLGEIEREDFEQGVWQGDDQYVSHFLTEARSLIARVREAIYAEYGVASSTLTPDQLEKRNTELGVHIIPSSDTTSSKTIDASKGAAWMHEPSYHALVKKLLNAMITNDHFYVILGGHSAAAGHGNNFHQSYMMQFHEIMEPIFDRLGMVLVSANRAQGGMGTAQAALAGHDIYGEKDVMLWDSSMTEKSVGAQELFMRQMLLTGHRVPILLDVGGGKITMDRIHQESGAHVGGLTTGNPSILAQTTSAEQAYKYTAKCWTKRVDVEPEKKQNEKYGSQVSWHPGNRSHQWTARKLSLLFLHALDKAINVWENAAASDGNPLPIKYWHLAAEENAIRSKLRNVDVDSTECGKFMSKIPRMCVHPMRGATEWAPRADPEHSSIRSLLKPAPSGYVPDLIDLETPPQLYDRRDPHFPTQRIPKGEVDVAAIARSIPASTNNDRWLMAPLHHLENTNSNSHHNKLNKHLRRLTSEIIPGEGWTVIGHPPGFCDGTSNGVCGRVPSSECIMSGHMDSRGMLVGDALSGWVTFQLTDVSAGIFAARIQYWQEHNSNIRTEGWNAVNNGRDDGRRQLKAPPPPLPDDFSFEVALNGVLQYSLNNTEFPLKCQPELVYNVPFCVLIDDEQIAKANKKMDIEVSLRIVGGGRESVLAITHVYYA